MRIARKGAAGGNQRPRMAGRIARLDRRGLIDRIAGARSADR